MPGAATAAPAPSAAGLTRWLPGSLFGRLMLVLAGGLLVAQGLSAWINLAERDRVLLAASGRQQAQRIADVVTLLDTLDDEGRARIVAVLRVPPLVLSLHDGPAPPVDDAPAPGPRAAVYEALLRSALDDGRAVQVDSGPARAAGRGGDRLAHHPGMGRGGPAAWGGPVLRTQVQLQDGSWARFDAVLPPAAASLPWRLALTLAVLLAAVLVVSLVAVRWLTRPLKVLAQAADELGRDIDRPPLPETGPLEIRQAARAFNTMQSRLSRTLRDRTQVLAAMSHDLKTPITRMRLRAALLDDDETRQRFESDLTEMQDMVAHALEFLRGLGGSEPRLAVDVNALLDSLQADNAAMGREVRIEGRAREPLVAAASLLKRCLANLVDNAVIYGARATLQVDDAPDALTVRVLDEGPGIPEDRLAWVFEPFQRLETSRNRDTGGTGLGLTIARNIAQAHGGDITLHNRPEGGLAAVLVMPRQPPAAA